MSRSLRPEKRGQTEPVAALVAVAAVCLAMSLYAGYAGDTLSGTSDRSVEETALDAVWTELSKDGLYTPGEDSLRALPRRAVPEGYHVRIAVSVESPLGEQQVVESTRVDAHGDGDPGAPPDDARTASRPIPVVSEELPGDVKIGRLRVEVWQ
ncbi:hypothetical protein ACFQH2_13220 [Natronoarchaeum sp. GCM10025703]|uniref:DUF7285 family protein n=1 Tax=unclassified Natronoarchaeum TaxID=2620183 RepID=UPI00360CEC89